MGVSRFKFALCGAWLAFLAYAAKIILHYPAPLAPWKCLLACAVGAVAFAALHLAAERLAPRLIIGKAMRPERGPLAQCLAVVLVLSCLVLFVLPLLAAGAREYLDWDYAANDLDFLYGVFIAKDEPQARTETVLDGSFQAKYTNYFNENFALRPLLIKLNNQLYYDFFAASYMYDDIIVVGKQDQLYERDYIIRQCGIAQTTDEQIANLYAEQLRQLQDLLAKRGITFLLLISPSKATTYPEFIPDLFRWFGHDGPRNRQILLPYLDKYGVNYYDAQQAMLDWRQKTPIPLFCQGGTHWNDLGALYAIQGMLAKLEALSGLSLVRPRLDGVVVDNHPTGYDRDLAELLNLYYQPYDFASPHPKVSLRRGPQTVAPGLAVVGGSFNWIILNLLHKYGVFQTMDFFYYYHTFYRHYQAGQKPAEKTTIDVWKMDWDKMVFDKQFVIVEMNESVIPFGNYVSAFIKGAFDNDAKSAPRP